MCPRWALFCAVLPLLAYCSGPNNCSLYESRFHDVSPAMESLQCYNDYNSQVHCQWREELSTQGGMPLVLWHLDPYTNRESLCVPTPGAAISQGDHHRLMRCRFNTTLFVIAVSHTFFFKTPSATSCSSFRHSLDLSQQLRVRPPVDLSFRIAEEGDLLIQWSSPYPDSSPLSRNLTYQLSYRREGKDVWIHENLTKTHLRLKKDRRDFPSQHPGCWYEARVRATRKSGGVWSEWSPLATWKTPEAAGQTPSMQCVLDEEEKVTCSWELRKELAHFVTYQVECRHKHPNTISKWCCDLQEVTPVLRHSEALLRYHCSINTSYPELLRLELVAKRNAKSFLSYTHIRPNPPSAVRVVEKGWNWLVTWKMEKPPQHVKLSYQVRYWNPLNKSQEDTHLISEPFTSLTITWASLGPSQRYKVQVRALLTDDVYKGVPSEWSQPAEWTSHAACAWSPKTFLYVALSVVVSVLFIALFFSIQSCRRKVLAWLNSGPSPDKSKLFLETKNLSCNHALLQKEVTDICRVKHLDSFSSCSSAGDTALEKKWWWQTSISEDEGCLDCDRMTTPHFGGRAVCADTSSSVSFNGPYIFCKGTPEPSQAPVDDRREAKVKDAQSVPVRSTPTASSCFRGDYVFLPSPGPPGPAEEPVAHGNHRNDYTATTEGEGCGGRGGQDMEEEGQSKSRAELLPGPGNCEPQPYTVMQFPAAPQGGTVQPSGYCVLP